MQFDSGKIFSYNHLKNKLYGLLSLFILGLIILVTGYYFMILRHYDIWFFKIIGQGVSHISYHAFTAPSLLGVLYTSLFGGLFFVFVPMEVMFVGFLKISNPFLVYIIFIFGLVISLTLNYYIGHKFSRMTKKVITPAKFYKLKGYINRFGGLAVFIVNVLPSPAPYQALAAILGVFRYNMSRFYFYTFLGQIIKFGILVYTFT